MAMGIIKERLATYIEDKSNNFIFGKHIALSPDEKFYVESHMDDGGLINLKINNKRRTVATEANLTMQLDPSFESVEHIAFRRSGTSETPPLPDESYEKNFAGAPEDLKLIQLGRVALNVRRAANTLHDYSI
jgi:hypothetical protein